MGQTIGFTGILISKPERPNILFLFQWKHFRSTQMWKFVDQPWGTRCLAFDGDCGGVSFGIVVYCNYDGQVGRQFWTERDPMSGLAYVRMFGFVWIDAVYTLYALDGTCAPHK